MQIYTVKNYITLLNKNKHKNKFELTFKGDQSGLMYKFTIHKDIRLEVFNPSPSEVGIMFKVTDLYRLKFEDKTLTPVEFTETSFRKEDEIFEYNKVNIFYPAQLYVKLFKVMRERVNFIFRSGNEYFHCYYVDGKVLYALEDATDYRIVGTTLYDLAKRYPDYEIVTASHPGRTLSYGEFIEKENELANKKCKRFVKVDIKNNNRGGARAKIS